jgi:hypothetical protein
LFNKELVVVMGLLGGLGSSYYVPQQTGGWFGGMPYYWVQQQQQQQRQQQRQQQSQPFPFFSGFPSPKPPIHRKHVTCTEVAHKQITGAVQAVKDAQDRAKG